VSLIYSPNEVDAAPKLTTEDIPCCMEAGMNNQDINVLAMIKGEERYIFLYNDDNRVEMLRTLGRYAADPQLSFSWYDAAVMSKKVREIAYYDLVKEINTCNSGLAESSDVTSPPSNKSHNRLSFRHEEDII
jgi:hypothetical protein